MLSILALFGTSASAELRILDDAIVGNQRVAVVVVEEVGGCVDPTTLRASGAARPLTACALEITGTATSPMSVTVGDQRLDLPASRVTLPPPSAVPDPTLSIQLAVRTVASLRVAVPTVAARIVAFERGVPSSNVELEIRSTRATLRALRWTEEGHAEVELVVARDVASADLTIVSAQGQLDFEIRIAPGAPIVVTRPTATEVVAGRRFELPHAVHTTTGRPVAADDVHVIAPPGCEAPSAARPGFRCAPGQHRFLVQVHLAGGLVPIDAFEISAIAPPTVVEPGSSSRWELAARGVRDGWGSVGGGVGVRASTRSGPWWPELAVGWTTRAKTLDGRDLVTAGLDLLRHEIAIGVGAAARVSRFEARVAAGPALTIDRGAIMASSSTTVGVAGWSAGAIGVALPTPRPARLDVGLQLSIDLAATAWSRPASTLFAEVSVGW